MTPSTSRKSKAIVADARARRFSRRDKAGLRYNAAAAASLWKERGFAGLTEIHQQLDRTEA
jgi:hypothetical protein